MPPGAALDIECLTSAPLQVRGIYQSAAFLGNVPNPAPPAKPKLVCGILFLFLVPGSSLTFVYFYKPTGYDAIFDVNYRLVLVRKEVY
jgi:hypothetical protein